ncbi:MAG: GNAT family N-acetyltransferase, partial [Dehalococcoidia bacterium]|nr:GNAT family N-acetyltransferase [Dehalococcoidia bacterium]
MTCSSCVFETSRLLVKEWHSLTSDDWDVQELAEVVMALLTAPVTRSLPPAWRGEYTLSRAQAWIQERDLEGTTLLAVSRSSRRPLGLMILFETESKLPGRIDIRLGYLLSESAWGTGIATEMIGGFSEWCRGQGSVANIIAG